MKKILTAAVLLPVCLFAFVGCSDGQAAQVSEAAHGDTTTLYGTESEGFPEFWEELLLLAGE